MPVHLQAMPALDLPRRLHGVRRYALPLAILILSLVVVACWSYSLQLQRDTLVAEKLARQEAEFSLKLAGRMRAYEQVLWGAAAWLASLGTSDPRTPVTGCLSALARHDGLRGTFTKLRH